MNRASVTPLFILAGLMLVSTLAKATSIAEAYVANIDPATGNLLYTCKEISTSSMVYCGGYMPQPAIATSSADASSLDVSLHARATGEAEVDMSDPPGSESGFWAESSDFLQVTGGVGQGSIFAHFSWQSAGDNNADVSAIVGSVHESFAVGCTSVSQTCTDTFDVSSPFTFGQPIAIGMLNQGFAVAQPYKDIWVYLMLTGFSVYDAEGYPVLNAVIAPQGANVNLFGNGPLDIPEPGTWLLLLSGSLALCAPHLRMHRFRRRDTRILHSREGFILAGGTTSAAGTLKSL